MRSTACGDDGSGLRRGLSDIVDAFSSLITPPRLVLILSPPPLLDYRAKNFNIEQRYITEAHGIIADVATTPPGATRRTQVALAMLPIRGDGRLYASDGLHLNANGSALLACAVHRELRRYGVVQCARQWSRRGGGSLNSGSGGGRRSCWDPFCTQVSVPDDDEARACEDESGVGAPFGFTGFACRPSWAAGKRYDACAALWGTFVGPPRMWPARPELEEGNA